ncbi:MAG: hypothetical protein BWX86_01893 [Verrucomicrobia bacterium ADurb.Bin122]|nr:MAG: hypothetical protein BWX86_01893 [Verrucomicrobia bacterium ADurb.Bin122]
MTGGENGLGCHADRVVELQVYALKLRRQFRGEQIVEGLGRVVAEEIADLDGAELRAEPGIGGAVDFLKLGDVDDEVGRIRDFEDVPRPAAQVREPLPRLHELDFEAQLMLSGAAWLDFQRDLYGGSRCDSGDLALGGTRQPSGFGAHQYALQRHRRGVFKREPQQRTVSGDWYVREMDKAAYGFAGVVAGIGPEKLWAFYDWCRCRYRVGRSGRCGGTWSVLVEFGQVGVRRCRGWRQRDGDRFRRRSRNGGLHGLRRFGRNRRTALDAETHFRGDFGMADRAGLHGHGNQCGKLHASLAQRQYPFMAERFFENA